MARRVLLSCFPGYGHLQPLIPLAAAFRDRGADVAVATEPDLCPRVEQMGFSAHPTGLSLLDSERAFLERFPDADTLAPERRLALAGQHHFVDIASRSRVPALAGSPLSGDPRRGPHASSSRTSPSGGDRAGRCLRPGVCRAGAELPRRGAGRTPAPSHHHGHVRSLGQGQLGMAMVADEHGLKDGPMSQLTGIHHVSITVSDIERSVPWYSDVLELTKLMDEPHPDGQGYAVVLGKPDWSMCVGLHTHPQNGGERFSETRTGLDHVCFRVPERSDLDEWERRLTRLGVEHSPVNDQGAYAVVVFRDPDNVQLELISMA